MNLLLFCHAPDYAAAAIRAGVDAIIVDWEFRAKERRQAGFDTEINEGTPEILSAVRAATSGRLVCRINNCPATRLDELRLACRLGADEILLPMVRTVDEVRECLAALPAGHRLGILAETTEAVALAADFAALPLARVYIGLNDLLIQRRSGHLFDPLIDGTLQRFRAAYPGPLSVAGVTLPDQGSPIPARLLMAELARLRCDYGVARRSFRRDIPLDQLPAGVASIRSAWAALQSRSPEEIERDRLDFLGLVRSLPALAAHAQAPCAS